MSRLYSSMTAIVPPGRCPHCGADKGPDDGVEGLCPQCLLSLALLASPFDADDVADAPTMAVGASGRLLGDRYQIRELLGRGGMGEVYRAFDLKLRVDVALKAVRPGHAWTEQARDMLRREVRSAREVVSPNVCRIFDLIDGDGEELLSMEYIDGATLAETLRARGPLALSEARQVASQFLSGLEAIHAAGLVHRDFKPENVMITRAARVVVMDFGVASGARDGPTRTISGTPAYMAPEQARGDPVDARADVFSSGVVLAEMLSVGGRGGITAREALWGNVRKTPPVLPDGPWAPVLHRALAPQPDARYSSARELARALEETTLRVPGFEERRPYPGLQAFTAEDAEYFFGREVEVEAVWKKLRRPRLLGLIGPSGAGKSSFLRAGLLPALPASWKAVLSTPGTRPFQALAQALVPQFAGDNESLQALVRLEDADIAVAAVARWRTRHEHAIVIVDQFEELFTLSDAAAQAAFARLLGRLVLEADTHVILALRDDFLVHCHGHEALAPMMSDLTILGPLGESGLRRALVQPALSCGYHFDDEALVQEMIDEVAGERGALPLLAFAASRLWEMRDREKGVLTRASYRAIGGVAGALAQHAESTLERIGAERNPIVRELFRNLVTSQGTRAVRDRDDLLSVFARDSGPDARQAAEAVLSALIDARLLTTYERLDDEGERRQQVEIIHESLLTAWPRLMRWRTQDADGAQLRDQLRQAAEMWHERGRPEDLLWSGTAYRDFAVWRERYPGGLSTIEEAFAEEAGRRAGRRRRRRRLAAAGVLAAVAAVAVTTSVLWWRSEALRHKAETETLRAEAAKLLVMGERELDRYPTAALAYTLKSLEVADGAAGRLLAVRALQRAPVARLAQAPEGVEALAIDFSPNGEWVAVAGFSIVALLHHDGTTRHVLRDYPPRGGGIPMEVRFGSGSDLLVANRAGEIRVWSVPDGRVLARAQVDDGRSLLRMGKDGFLTITAVGERRVVRFWPLPSGEPRLLGSIEGDGVSDATGQGLAYVKGRSVYLRPLEDSALPPRLVAEAPADVLDIAMPSDASRVATRDLTNETRIWTTAAPSTRPERVLKSPESVVGVGFDPTGRWVGAWSFERGYPKMGLFDLVGTPGASPMVLQRADLSNAGLFAFDRTGRWLATPHATDVAFWYLGSPHPQVLESQGPAPSVQFAPDNRWLVSLGADRSVWVWPVPGVAGTARIVLPAAIETPAMSSLAVDPSGRLLALSGSGERILLVPVDGGPVRSLPGFPKESFVGRPAFGEGGRLLAAGLIGGPRQQKLIRVWDVQTGAVRTFGPVPGAGDRGEGGIPEVLFAGPDRLLALVRGTGILSLDLASGASRVAVAHSIETFAVSRDGRFGMGANKWGKLGPLVRFNLDDGSARPLSSHGADVTAVALDPTDSLVATGSADGTIRVGPVSGEEPHVLLGQEGAVRSVAFSPDGRWLAASGEAFAIRIWPVPDISRPPLHRRPIDELLAVLRGHTNLRAVPDPASRTGYRLEAGPFPGWATPPGW